jgi:peptide-methionine (S)-S-oxide reductase
MPSLPLSRLRFTVSALIVAGGLALTLGATPLGAAPALQTAVFAGGCFWTMEHGLEGIPGVVKAVAGYAGGTAPHPTYEQVSSETTGYLESVQVTYDPAKISYAQLVDRYWRLIDPTDDGGQACDRGPSYHSAIFAASPEQRAAAERSKAAISAGPLHGKPVATFIRPAATFWPAEGYHQHYADRNPLQYGAYRVGCGRDTVLKALWGAR